MYVVIKYVLGRARCKQYLTELNTWSAHKHNAFNYENAKIASDVANDAKDWVSGEYDTAIESTE